MTRYLLILVTIILAGPALLGCTTSDAELAYKGRHWPMESEDCVRIQARIGGLCYRDDGGDLEAFDAGN